MSIDLSKLPNWNARKLREASVPLKGKPLRDIKNYLKSKMDTMPLTALGDAFRRAINA